MGEQPLSQAQRDGLRNSSLHPIELKWPNPRNTVGCGRANAALLRVTQFWSGLPIKEDTSECKINTVGTWFRSDESLCWAGVVTRCSGWIRECKRSSGSKNWMFLIPVLESGPLQVGVVEPSAATPRASLGSSPHCLVHIRNSRDNILD